MFNINKTWPLTKPNLQCLQWNDRAMIRQICNVRPQDIVTTRSNELLAQLFIEELGLILKERRLHWYGHGLLQWCSEDSLWHTGWWKAWAWEAQDDIEAADREGCREWKLSAIYPHDRHTWNTGVRSTMPAASQLPGRGPFDVDVVDERRFRDIQLVIITNFVVVSSVGIKRVDCKNITYI